MKIKEILSCITVLLAGTVAAFAQKTEVKGLLKGLKDDSVEIYYSKDGKPTIEKVAVDKGKFIWVGDLQTPQKVYLLLSTHSYEFYGEQGHISVEADVENDFKLRVKGSGLQEEADKYGLVTKSLSEAQNEIYQKLDTVSEEEALSLNKRLVEISEKKEQLDKGYIKAHPSSYLSLDMVAEKSKFGSYDDVVELFEMLEPSIKNSSVGQATQDRITVLKRSALGQTVPDFIQNDTEGKPVRFADFRGKYVLIDFWASWCGPCRQENPNLVKDYNKFKDKGFTIIGVSLDQKADQWKKAIEEDGLIWTQVSDLKGDGNEISTYYGVLGIPSSILIGPDGKIIAKDLRGYTLTKKLEDILN